MRDKVLAAIEIYAAGGTIEKACELANVSNTPFRRLLREDAEIHDKYEMAMRARGFVYHDEAYKVAAEIGTEQGLNAADARTKADILLKLGGQAFPDRFGNKVAISHEVKPSLIDAIDAGKQRSLRPGRDLTQVIDATYTENTNTYELESSDKQSDKATLPAADGLPDPFAP